MVMQSIPCLGLSISHGVLLLLFISAILTLYGYYNIQYSEKERIQKIKKQEEKLNNYDFFLLYTTRFLHYFGNVWGIFVIFIFKPNFVLYVIYLLCFSLIFINLLLLHNECPASYLEKKILDKNYVFNQTKNEQIYNIIIYCFCEKYIDLVNQYGVIYASILYLFYSTIIITRIYKNIYLPKSKIPEEIRM
jgi:hypothetical protein